MSTTSPSATSASTTPVIILLALAAFASASAFRICDPLLPVLATEFGVRTAQASNAVTFFSIAYGVMQFFYGPVGDRYGKFRVLSIATLGCAFGSLVIAVAPTLEMVVIGRFIAGATAAGIVPLSMAWIGDNVAYEQRQATLARFLLGSISGLAAGQLLGGVFADTIGWRWAFVAMALVYLIVGSLLISKRHLVPEKLAPRGQRRNLLAPLKQVGAIPWAREVIITVFLEGALVFGPLAFVPAYLHEHLGIAVSWAGVIGGLFAVGALMYALRANQLIGFFGERRLALFGGSILALAYSTYWFAGSWHWAVLASILSGFGYYLLHAVLQTNATQMAPAVRGTAVSLFASFLFLGQSVGVTAAALLVDVAGLGAVFPVGILTIPVLALVFAWRLRKRHVYLASQV
jgi:predicted MFS family arabinose efflux permease